MKRTPFQLVLIAVLATSCHGTDLGLAKYRAMNSCDDHFPRGTFPQQYDTEDFIREWYSTPLRALEAPCLRDLELPATQVYRFTWMPSFDPTVVATVFISGDECRIYGASVSWEIDTFMPLSVKNVEVGETVEVAPGRQTCAELTSLIDQSAFWRMPTVDPKGGGLDGAQWILEGVRQGGYHVTDRWAPPVEYREAFRGALRAAGLYPESFERY
jgi:hypothetical protein